MLDSQVFANIVAVTPLVSIDLVVLRGGREVLLGLRNNRPAKGSWFVPGGRIFKDESMRTALFRIAEKELGLGKLIGQGELTLSFHGAYEHMYSDCFAGDIGVTTHYVVLAHKVECPNDFALPVADEQHAELKWWTIEDAMKSPEVHQYTKNYFLDL